MSIELEFFDPKYWMFNLGLSLNRYEEHDNHYQWVRKEFVIGLLLFNIKFHIERDKMEKGS